MKVASLIARRGDEWDCLGCGVDVAELSQKQDALITALGKDGKGKDAIKYDEVVLLTSVGIKKRRKL
jgi:hypothetical protein